MNGDISLMILLDDKRHRQSRNKGGASGARASDVVHVGTQNE
jgi:hypothetical protein